MKIIAVWLGATLALVGAIAATAAEPVTVGRLHDDCLQPEASAKAAYCAGYLVAMVDSMRVNAQYGGKEMRVAYGICPPVAPTAVEVVKVFKDWSEVHPEWYAAPGWDGASAALRNSWPCLPK